MYNIEKNIPVPAKRDKDRIYPFSQMRKGDSFFIPAKTKKEQAAKRRAASANAHKRKVKITARAVEGGVRVWRVG